MRRFQCDRAGSAARIAARLETRTVTRRRRRRTSHHRPSSSGAMTRLRRASGQVNDIYTTLPNQRSMRIPPANSRPMAMSANRAVISVVLLTVVTRRSIDSVMVSRSPAVSPVA